MESSYKQGSESKLYSLLYLNQNAIVKERFSKQYRNKSLDYTIRKERTKTEAKAILRCKQGGMSTPVLYYVDLVNCKIIMENINGQTVNDYFIHLKENKVDNDAKLAKLLLNIGATIGKMHSLGVFHGDLTTSNIIKKEDDTVVIIDFGLSHFNPSIEDKAVDLHVFERSFENSHSYFSDLFAAILDGYKNAYETNFQTVINQYQNVRARGRKRLSFG